MSVANLVQVDDNAWIDPETVVAIKHWPPAKVLPSDSKLSRDNTTLIHANGTHTVCYWPHERVLDALGVTRPQAVTESEQS